MTADWRLTLLTPILQAWAAKIWWWIVPSCWVDSFLDDRRSDHCECLEFEIILRGH
jgi:hypothetical protein